MHVQFDNTSSENVLESMEAWRPLLELKLQQCYSNSYITKFCIQLMKALWLKHLAIKWLLILVCMYMLKIMQFTSVTHARCHGIKSLKCLDHCIYICNNLR